MSVNCCEVIVEQEKTYELIETDCETIVVEQQQSANIVIDVQPEIVLEKEYAPGKVDEVVIGIPDHTHTSPLRVVELTASDIFKGLPHTLPNGLKYRLDPSHHGRNLHVYVAGQFLTPHSSDTAMDRDYQETNETQITFTFDIGAETLVNYIFFN
jgi:hypothetical protein